MKAGLFFGSFNPIHVGHLIVANHFIEFSDIEEVWFVVSPQNPFKEKGTLIDAKTRFKMVEAMTKDHPHFYASDAEFNLPTPSYTIDILKYFKKKFPWMNFVLLMGSDTYQSLKDWKDAYIILNDYTIYVYQRRDAEIKLKGTAKEKNVTLFDFPFVDISATYIRELLEKGKSVKYLVPEKALKILKP